VSDPGLSLLEIREYGSTPPLPDLHSLLALSFCDALKSQLSYTLAETRLFLRIQGSLTLAQAPIQNNSLSCSWRFAAHLFRLWAQPCTWQATRLGRTVRWQAQPRARVGLQHRTVTAHTRDNHGLSPLLTTVSSYQIKFTFNSISVCGGSRFSCGLIIARRDMIPSEHTPARSAFKLQLLLKDSCA